MKLRLAKIITLFLLAAFIFPTIIFASDSKTCQSNFKAFSQEAKNKLNDLDQNTGRIVSQTWKITFQLARSEIPSKPDRNKSFWAKGLYYLNANLIALGRALSPIPISKTAKTEVQRVYGELWANPKMLLTHDQEDTLKSEGLYEDFLKRQDILAKYPRAVDIKKSFKVTKRTLEVAAAGAALTQAYQLANNSTNVEDFLNEPNEDKNGNPVVQVIVETTPFPHLAIRIGAKVYSYGVKYMTSRSIYEYFQDDVIAPLNSDGTSKPTKLSDKLSTSANHVVSQLAERSIRITNLNLTVEKLRKLQRDLELETGKTYNNITLVNDCGTMIKRALERDADFYIPYGIDTGPSTTSTYLGLRHFLGDSQVGTSKLLLMQPKSNKAYHIARNTYIAILEAKAILFGALNTIPQRAAVDIANTDSDLSYYEPEQAAEIEAWKAHARGDVENDLSSIFHGDRFFEKIRTLPRDKRNAKIAAANEALRLAGQRLVKEARSIIDDPNAEFVDLIPAMQKEETAKKLIADYQERLNALDRL